MTTTRKDSTITWIVMCAIVFCIFSFEYIFFYQTPTIAYAQHVLSGGKTRYNPVIGAILITLVAMLLQFATFRLTQLRKRCHALTYFPSMLFISAITSCHKVGNSGVEWDTWLYFIPIMLVAYAVVVRLVNQWIPARSVHVPIIYSPQLTLNLLIMVLMMVFVCK